MKRLLLVMGLVGNISAMQKKPEELISVFTYNGEQCVIMPKKFFFDPDRKGLVKPSVIHLSFDKVFTYPNLLLLRKYLYAVYGMDKRFGVPKNNLRTLERVASMAGKLNNQKLIDYCAPKLEKQTEKH